MTTTEASSSIPTTGRSRLRTGLQVFPTFIGVMAFGVMAAASVLWWTSGNGFGFGTTGHALVYQASYLMGWKEWSLLVALSAVLGVLFWRIVVRSGTRPLHVVTTLLVAPAIIAPGYAMTLPSPQPLAGDILRGPEILIRWPLLALGIQLAMLGVYLSVRTLIQHRFRVGAFLSRPGLILVAIGVASPLLITYGLRRIVY